MCVCVCVHISCVYAKQTFIIILVALGSCRAAGYTGCCRVGIDSPQCGGWPATCYCDISCLQFGDCCDDFAALV